MTAEDAKNGTVNAKPGRHYSGGLDLSMLINDILTIVAWHLQRKYILNIAINIK